jgi:hypothetical protein
MEQADLRIYQSYLYSLESVGLVDAWLPSGWSRQTLETIARWVTFLDLSKTSDPNLNMILL